MRRLIGQTINGYALEAYLGGGGFGDVYLARRGELALPTYTMIVEQVCAALTFTHQHQIVHHDLKPENILLLEPII